MAKCPYCNTKLTFSEINKVEESDFLKIQTIYSCPKCEKILGFGSRH